MPFGVQYAHTVLLNKQAYIGGGLAEEGSNQYIVMKYDPTSGKWSQLPKSNASYFAMASVSDRLVLAGGGGNSTDVQVLDSENHCWKTHHYPKMPTARPSPAAVSYSHYLIVACGLPYKNTVEVLDCSTRQWHNAESLPKGGNRATAVIISDYIYISSYVWVDDQPHIFSAHLPMLLMNAINHTTTSESPVWQELPTPPVHEPTPLALQNHLLLIGGKEKNKELYIYLPDSKEWRACGQLPVGMHGPSCTELPSCELLVAGGIVEGDREYSQEVWIGSLDYTYESKMDEMDFD